MNSVFDIELLELLESSKTKPRRSIIQFVQDEIRIPSSSKYAGERIRFDRQPVQRLYLEQYANPHWLDIIACGPSQSGKTVTCFNLPLTYFAAELGENVVVGVPDGTMVNDKWSQDIKPMFEASPGLRRLLPKIGQGSRGGSVRDEVKLENGASIRFMTRAGSDQSKAGFTARVVVVTEAAAWGGGTETSEEADPLRQLRARQRSWDRAERLLAIEGTGTIEEDYPWSLHKISSKSQLLCPCPNCGEYVEPCRSNLKGWQECDSEDEAAALAYFECPRCGDPIDDDGRRWSVENVKIVHGGQEIDRKGNIHGPLPISRRLWFRWGGWHNLFSSIGSLAAEEWKKTQEVPDSPAEDSAERELCQFIWAIPYKAELGDTVVIDAKQAATRKAEIYAHEILPEDTTHLSLGIDIGKRKGHFVWIAGRSGGKLHIPAYGEFDIEGDEMNGDLATKLALIKFWEETVSVGLMYHGQAGRVMLPNAVLCDANYHTRGVFEAWKVIAGGKRNSPFMPIMGRGSSQIMPGYSQPKKRGSGVIHVGDNYYTARYQKEDIRSFITYVNVDHWKDTFHGHLTIPIDSVGSLTLYAAPDRDHLRLTQHWAGEQRKEKFKPGKGKQVYWDRKTKQQHWFDGSIYARVGLDRAGWRVLPKAS